MAKDVVNMYSGILLSHKKTSRHYSNVDTETVTPSGVHQTETNVAWYRSHAEPERKDTKELLQKAEADLRLPRGKGAEAIN